MITSSEPLNLLQPYLLFFGTTEPFATILVMVLWCCIIASCNVTIKDWFVILKVKPEWGFKSSKYDCFCHITELLFLLQPSLVWCTIATKLGASTDIILLKTRQCANWVAIYTEGDQWGIHWQWHYDFSITVEASFPHKATNFVNDFTPTHHGLDDIDLRCCINMPCLIENGQAVQRIQDEVIFLRNKSLRAHDTDIKDSHPNFLQCTWAHYDAPSMMPRFKSITLITNMLHPTDTEHRLLTFDIHPACWL